MLWLILEGLPLQGPFPDCLRAVCVCGLAGWRGEGGYHLAPRYAYRRHCCLPNAARRRRRRSFGGRKSRAKKTGTWPNCRNPWATMPRRTTNMRTTTTAPAAAMMTGSVIKANPTKADTTTIRPGSTSSSRHLSEQLPRRNRGRRRLQSPRKHPPTQGEQNLSPQHRMPCTLVPSSVNARPVPTEGHRLVTCAARNWLSPCLALAPGGGTCSQLSSPKCRFVPHAWHE